jgi:hypothetical protein
MIRQGEKYPSIALNTFNEFQCMVKVIRHCNPSIDTEMIIEEMGYIFDAVIHYICDCMLWDIEESGVYVIISDHILYEKTFSELVEAMEG